MANFDNITPPTSAFIDSDNNINDIEQVLTSGAVVVTAASPGPVVPIGQATVPKFENITPWIGAFINPDNDIIDLMQFLTSGAIQVQVAGGGGGGAPTDATYITQDDESLALPNSVPLSGLPTGLLASETSTGILTARTLTGTANQLVVANGDGSANPTFSLSPTLVLPGTITLGGDLITNNFSLTQVAGSMNITAPVSIALNTPAVGINSLRHIGDVGNKILFGTGIQQFLPNNTLQFQISASGVQIGAAGATVNTISTDPTLGANSDTELSTQKAIKTYVNNTEAAIRGATYITQNDETAMLPNSTSTAGLADGFATVFGGILGTQILSGTANQIDVVGGDASSSAAVFSLPNTLITPGSLDVGTIFSIGGTGAIISITNNPASASSNALMDAGTVQAAIAAAITAGTSFRGGWDASGGLYPTTGGSGGGGSVAAGDWWYITVAGTLNTTPVSVGDQIFALVATPGQTDANWLAVGQHVASVFGRTGAVVATSGDYSFSLISGTAGISQGGTGLTATGANGHVLTALGGAWVSAAPIISSVFGRTGVVVAQTNDYSFSQISGTAAVSQGGTGLTTPGASGNVLTSDGAGNWVSQVPPSAPVSSVFGRTGAVVATSGDYSFSLISGIAVETQGGTNQSTYTKGDILHASAANTLSKLAIGSTGDVLTVSGSDVVWAAPATAPVLSVFGRNGAVVATSGDYSFSLISGTAVETQGGTHQTTYTTGDLLYASGANTLAKLPIGTVAQVLTVVSGNVAWANIPSAPVSSVFGRTGVVVATSGDYSFSLISGTAIETQGGTNQTTYIKGDILHASAANTLSKLAIGSTGNVLTVSGSDTVWAAPAVASVFGRTGAVVATSGDYSFSLISGTAVETQGGTNQTSYAKGDLLHATAANTLGKLGIGSTGQFLTIAASDVVWSTATIPATATSAGKLLRADGTNWAATTATYPDTVAANTLLYGSASNVVSALAAGTAAVLTASSAGALTWKQLTNGQIIIGSTAGSPNAANITANAPLAVSNGSNVIALSLTGIIDIGHGGTEITSYAAGDMIYAPATNTLDVVPIGTTGQVLTVIGGFPSWQTKGSGYIWMNTGDWTGVNFAFTTAYKELASLGTNFTLTSGSTNFAMTTDGRLKYTGTPTVNVRVNSAVVLANGSGSYATQLYKNGVAIAGSEIYVPNNGTPVLIDFVVNSVATNDYFSIFIKRSASSTQTIFNATLSVETI